MVVVSLLGKVVLTLMKSSFKQFFSLVLLLNNIFFPRRCRYLWHFGVLIFEMSIFLFFFHFLIVLWRCLCVFLTNFLFEYLSLHVPLLLFPYSCCCANKLINYFWCLTLTKTQKHLKNKISIFCFFLLYSIRFTSSIIMIMIILFWFVKKDISSSLVIVFF